MFINARPRPDLSGFRTFVPSRIVELSYHWPNSMTNQGTNTWRGTTSPAAAPAVWSYRSESASNAESYSNSLAQNFYSESSEAIPSYIQARRGNNPILVARRRVESPRLQPTTLIQQENQPPYDLQEIQSPRLESAMPPLIAAADSHEWIMGRSAAANSSRFPRAQYTSNAFSYADEPSLEVNDATSISSSAAGASLFSLYDASPTSDDFGSNKFEADTHYTNSPEHGLVSFSSMAVSSTAATMTGSFNHGRLWHEMGQSSNLVDPCGVASAFSYDSLPNVPSALWPTQSEPFSTWSQQTTPPGTVSPQALSLMALSSSSIPGDSSPISNSGWLSETSVISQAFQESVGDVPHATVQSVRSMRSQAKRFDGDMPHATAQSASPKAFQIQSSDGDMPRSSMQPTTSQRLRSTWDRPPPTTLSVTSQATVVDGSVDDMPHRAVGPVTSQGFQTQQSAGAVQHPSGRTLRPRRKLPSGRMSEVDLPSLSSTACVLSRSHKGLALAGSRIHGGRPDDPQSSLFIARQYPRKISSLQRALGPEKREIKATEKQISDITTESSKCAATSSGTQDTALERIAKDKFLLDSKREGKSYKQIRIEGGFTEAESTLRGRHRTLTKKPEERVRKPEWECNDLRLLKKAVHKLAGEPSLSRPKKLSWKKVSDYIVENGGSYRFGNSTCRKKWSELYAKSSDQDLF